MKTLYDICDMLIGECALQMRTGTWTALLMAGRALMLAYEV